MSIGSVPASTSDERDELLNQLRDLIPAAFPDGELDVSALLGELDVNEPTRPAFSFTWPGIEQARAEARAGTTATLVPDKDASVNWDATRDVLIEGDNLQVLKLLKGGYSGQTKLIYVDPPYNTGDTFNYNDDFSVPESEYLTSTGQMDEQGNATTSKIENAGRKHAPWLTMMFSRLAIARHLLRRDGVILLSVDNNEVHHLRLLLDAVFGATNFVDMITWQGGRKGDAKLTAGGHDYVLIYARDRSHLTQLDVRWRERKTGLEPVYDKTSQLLQEFGDDFTSAGKALRKWYRELPEGNPAKQHSHFNQIDIGGVWTSGDASSPNFRENLVYDLEGYSAPENGWRYERTVMERLAHDGKLLYPENAGGRVRIKRYLKDQERWAPGSVFYKERGAAQTSLNALMDTEVFDYPKDVGVLARFIDAITSADDLVIDFFAGSGSTGQAVWEQNAKDGKIRHWVLVQLPEEPDDSEDTGKNAIEAGYETIFEVTAERLRRSAAALQEQTLDTKDLGFRVFRTRPTNLVIEPPIMATEGMTGTQYVQTSLANVQGDPVVTGSSPLAVAWEVALKSTATRLDARVKEHTFGSVTVYEFLASVQDGASNGRLLISLDAFDLTTADALKLGDEDTLILRGDKVSDSTTLTLAPRLQSKLVLLERVPREVSL